MLTETSYFAAFLVGLLGGIHCVGMCGGIVGVLSFSLGQDQQGAYKKWPYLLAYNLARISSYTLAGFLLGGFSALAVKLVAINQLQQIMLALAGLFMILLGFYLAGWWRILARVEQAGSLLWKKLEPLGRRFLPVRHPRQAFALGLIWGWLPCGLVYSVLIWSIASGNAVSGAGLMLSFGLGTLPNLLTMGLFAGGLQHWVQKAWLRQLAGSLIMAFGGLEIWRALAGLMP